MKIAEVRKNLQGYNREKLESIILEMYKAMPKSMKEAKRIDIIILNPDAKPTRRLELVHRDLRVSARRRRNLYPMPTTSTTLPPTR
jgi:hypothetical protein